MDNKFIFLPGCKQQEDPESFLKIQRGDMVVIDLVCKLFYCLPSQRYKVKHRPFPSLGTFLVESTLWAGWMLLEDTGSGLRKEIRNVLVFFSSVG